MTAKDQSGFTPGPWKVEDRRHAPLKNIRVVSGYNEVCEVSSVHQRDYLGGFSGDNKAADAIDAVGLANARLIAAAPDMLAALRAIAADEPDLCLADIVDVARAAIAKAVN